MGVKQKPAAVFSGRGNPVGWRASVTLGVSVPAATVQWRSCPYNTARHHTRRTTPLRWQVCGGRRTCEYGGYARYAGMRDTLSSYHFLGLPSTHGGDSVPDRLRLRSGSQPPDPDVQTGEVTYVVRIEHERHFREFAAKLHQAMQRHVHSTYCPRRRFARCSVDCLQEGRQRRRESMTRCYSLCIRSRYSSR